LLCFHMEQLRILTAGKIIIHHITIYKWR